MMISIGLSEEERRVLRDIIGNLDPKDNITVSKFSADEYLVELFPPEGEIITAHREEKPPLKIKPLFDKLSLWDKMKIKDKFMLTEEDIKRIIEVVATKEDVLDMRQDINALREMVQSLVISTDKLVKAIDDLKMEYISIAGQVNRHEKWFHQLAEKIGIKLEY